MDRLIIYSKKHGNKIVYFDECDFELVLPYRWSLIKIDDCFYAHAWTQDDKGKPRIIKMHRLILGFPQYKIDHKDGDGLNNRRANLRGYEGGQNKMNSKIPKNNTSGFKGVTFISKKMLWVVHIGFEGKSIKGGRFKNKYKAALRYNELAIKYFGEFANLNILTEEEIEASKVKEGRRLSERNNTGYRGVYKYGNKFVARIAHDKVKIHVGYFSNPKLAAIAYNETIIKNNLPIEKLNKI